MAEHLTTIAESIYGKPELKSDRLSIYTLKYIKIRKLNSNYARYSSSETPKERFSAHNYTLHKHNTKRNKPIITIKPSSTTSRTWREF